MLSPNPKDWRFQHHDHGPQFGVTVVASIGEGDMTFEFEITNMEPVAQCIRDMFPPQIIQMAQRLLSLPE